MTAPESTPRRPRRPPSRHGLLFGGDALYQVLAQLAKRGAREFTTQSMSRLIGRTPEHTRREIEKLIALGAVEEVRRQRKTRVYKVRDTPLAEELLDLPDVLVAELGRYRRPR
jgi:hypothetical protein